MNGPTRLVLNEVATCHLPKWINPDTGQCEHVDHDACKGSNEGGSLMQTDQWHGARHAPGSILTTCPDCQRQMLPADDLVKAKAVFEAWFQKQYAGDFTTIYGRYEFLRRDEVRCGDVFWSSYHSGLVRVYQTSTGGKTTELRYYLSGGEVSRLERADRDSRVPVLSHSEAVVPLPPAIQDGW